MNSSEPDRENKRIRTNGSSPVPVNNYQKEYESDSFTVFRNATNSDLPVNNEIETNTNGGKYSSSSTTQQTTHDISNENGAIDNCILLPPTQNSAATATPVTETVMPTDTSASPTVISQQTASNSFNHMIPLRYQHLESVNFNQAGLLITGNLEGLRSPALRKSAAAASSTIETNARLEQNGDKKRTHDGQFKVPGTGHSAHEKCVDVVSDIDMDLSTTQDGNLTANEDMTSDGQHDELESEDEQMSSSEYINPENEVYELQDSGDENTNVVTSKPATTEDTYVKNDEQVDAAQDTTTSEEQTEVAQDTTTNDKQVEATQDTTAQQRTYTELIEDFRLKTTAELENCYNEYLAKMEETSAEARKLTAAWKVDLRNALYRQARPPYVIPNRVYGRTSSNDVRATSAPPMGAKNVYGQTSSLYVANDIEAASSGVSKYTQTTRASRIAARRVHGRSNSLYIANNAQKTSTTAGSDVYTTPSSPTGTNDTNDMKKQDEQDEEIYELTEDDDEEDELIEEDEEIYELAEEDESIEEDEETYELAEEDDEEDESIEEDEETFELTEDDDEEDESFEEDKEMENVDDILEYTGSSSDLKDEEKMESSDDEDMFYEVDEDLFYEVEYTQIAEDGTFLNDTSLPSFPDDSQMEIQDDVPQEMDHQDTNHEELSSTIESSPVETEAGPDSDANKENIPITVEALEQDVTTNISFTVEALEQDATTNISFTVEAPEQDATTNTSFTVEAREQDATTTGPVRKARRLGRRYFEGCLEFGAIDTLNSSTNSHQNNNDAMKKTTNQTIPTQIPNANDAITQTIPDTQDIIQDAMEVLTIPTITKLPFKTSIPKIQNLPSPPSFPPFDTQMFTEDIPDSQYEAQPSFHTDTQITPESWVTVEKELISNYDSKNSPDNLSTVTLYDEVIENGNLKLWWYDACVAEKNTHIYLFGKAYDKTHNGYVSCCLVIENIEREIFVLPRKYRLDDEDQATQQVVTMVDVMNELKEKLEGKGICDYTMQVATKKYAFDLPEVPLETEYIRLRYPFHNYHFTLGASGQTFSRMFGNSVKPLQQFIIEKKIMGPCWLEIKAANPLANKQSWCKVEAGISNPMNCSVTQDVSNLMNPPPLNIMALSVYSNLDRKKMENEVWAVSGFVCPDADINNQESATSLPFRRFAITRPIKHAPTVDHKMNAFTLANEEQKRTQISISLEYTEEALLHNVLAQIQLHDADIIVGHEFTNVDLDILLHRMKECGVYGWSRLGRLRQNKFPKLQPGAGGAGTSMFDEQQLMRGRIVCDTYIASKDLVNAKSYRLTDLALSELNIIREDLKREKIKECNNTGTLDIELARRGTFDAYLAFALMVKLQILPLTMQLTNLSGNLWHKSMNGARNDRNDYLLLHTFYNKGYVCPDKPNGHQKTLEMEYDDDTLELERSSKKRQGDTVQPTSYVGGLVLEPRAGLYDKYVVLLDFNSLYPSIMQEYNVCFTTMMRDQQGALANTNAAEPDPNCPEGILPSLVRMFVNQRRQVKAWMKNPDIPKCFQTKFDIQQKALKLTANSMYGCLGSSTSRFYARPLAMYITSKGREILRSTVLLAERKGLEVIYGDTDSIMINTNQSTMKKAKAIGEEFMQHVNILYKELDLGMDGLFRHTLLLRKKKYAALSVKEKPNGEGLQESHEIKGLDLVRRDWCDLSHEVSKHVLKIILSDKDRREVVDEIHEYMRETATRIEMNDFEIDEYIIRKQLNKEPEEYHKGKTPPHVKVAKVMRQASIPVKPGDTIPYVMCLMQDPEGSGNVISAPCMPEDAKNGVTHLDLKWYLHKQIMPPVNRLCGPIEGADLESLAVSLGLDKQEMLQRLEDDAELYAEEEEEEEPMEQADKSDEILFTGPERYANIEPLALSCNHCGYESHFSSQEAVSNAIGFNNYLICESCLKAIKMPTIYMQIKNKIRELTRQYYASPYICNQASCDFSTQYISAVTGAVCRKHGCNGRLFREFSERQLYDQLSYMEYLFEWLNDGDDFYCVKLLVKENLNLCGYKFVDLSKYTF